MGIRGFQDESELKKPELRCFLVFLGAISCLGGFFFLFTWKRQEPNLSRAEFVRKIFIPLVAHEFFLQISRMPEVRNSGGRAALADPSGGGFFIRRTTSPPGAVAVKPLARRALPPTSNKENVPPSWAVTVRATPKRRSPLPEWYPRSPLRDITSVVKVMNHSRRLCGGLDVL